MPYSETIPFAILLRQLRKRAGMTQGDLAAALDCSDAQISKLEKAQRQPDIEAVITRFVPALGLQDDPVTAALLIERAAAARGEHPPASVTLQRTTRFVLQEEAEGRPQLLPLPPTELIGRTAEVQQLCNRLMGHSGRLLTLVGPPGIGKTRLALAMAARLQYHYPDGALFVPLAEIRDVLVMASTITAALGRSDATPKPPKVKLIESLRRKTMLLVLDNCEQIQDAAALVAEVLSSCGGVVVLTTSRERLHLRAEQRYHVPPLELASAVELFTQRAATINVSFGLTEANRPTIEAICQRLDRLPLALELCAAQTDLLSLAQLLIHLADRRLDLLVDGAYDLPARQRTLRHAIQSSFALLSEEERMVFRTLGIFVGGFAFPEFESVSLTKEESQARPFAAVLHALIHKSLVRSETTPEGEQRFLLLETIREFALEQVRAQGEEAQLRQRHFDAYLQLVRIVDSHLRRPEAENWLARLQAEQENVRAALQWALDEARFEEAAWLMVAIHYYWYLSGQRYEGARWLAQLLPHRHMLAVDLQLAFLICFFASGQELDGLQLDRYKSELMQLIDECPNQQLQAAGWCFLAWSASDLSQATFFLERSLALTSAVSEVPAHAAKFSAMADHNFVLPSLLQTYAMNLIELGNFEQAALINREGLQLFQALGDRYGIADCLANRGRLAMLRGDLAQARILLLEVMTPAKALNLRLIQRRWQPLLGIITLYCGDAAEAQRLLHESLRLSLESKNRVFLARTYTYLAETALWDGALEEAEQWLAKSLEYQPTAQANSISEIERLWVAARLSTARQQYGRAATLFGLAAQMCRNIDYVSVGPMAAPVDAALGMVQAALSPTLFAKAFSAGEQLSLDVAFATLLSPELLLWRMTNEHMQGC